MTAQIPVWFERFKDQISWQEFNQNIHIDLVRRYVYVETPKAACSTVKSRLYGDVTRGLLVPNEIHPASYHSPFVRPFQLPDDLLKEALYGDKFFRFSFVREPIERVLSAYLDKIQKPMPQRERFLKQFFPGKSSDYILSFAEFVKCLETIKSYRNFDKHWRPQYNLLFLSDLEYQFIGCLNRFEEDWKKVLSAIKIDGAGHDENNIMWHATSAREKLEEYVTDDVLSILNDVYKMDISLYAKILNSS